MDHKTIERLIRRVSELERKVELLTAGKRPRTEHFASLRELPPEFIAQYRGQQAWAEDLYRDYLSNPSRPLITELHFNKLIDQIPNIIKERDRTATGRKKNIYTIPSETDE